MLSATAEYALRIMIVLAEGPEEPITSEKIAERTKVPPDYSVKVLQMLARAGLVRAQRGRSGGFHIDCDMNVTSLLDVVNAIDPIRHITCPMGGKEQEGGLCPLHSCLDEIVTLLETNLRKMTLRSVLDSAEGSALCKPSEPAEQPTPQIVTGKAAPHPA